MKKLLALTLAALFLSVGIASATDFTLTGSYFARGTWSDNLAGTGRDADPANLPEQFGDYDHEMSLDANWKISDATRVFARFEIRDETWGYLSNPSEGDTPGVNSEEYDDNIIVERLWGSHNFGQGTTVRVGKVGTSSWAFDFGNNGTEAYRVQVNHMTPLGMAIFFTEKPDNQQPMGSETGAMDADRDDYVAALVTKVGGVTLYPLLKYVDFEYANMEVMALDFGAEGTFNNLAWKAELVYADYDRENATDYELWGFFAEMAIQLNAFKITPFFAYASYDDNVHLGYAMGDDFTANGAMILGDDAFMYQNGGGADDLIAATLYGIKGSWAFNEKMTLSAYFGYADSNVDNPADPWDGGSAWEVNVQGEYKITDNVTYSVGLAQAQLEYGDGSPDPDEAIEAFHMLNFNF